MSGNWHALHQFHRRLALQTARPVRDREVAGSIPASPTNVLSGCMSVRLDDPPWKREAAGSNPAAQTNSSVVREIQSSTLWKGGEREYQGNGEGW